MDFETFKPNQKLLVELCSSDLYEGDYVSGNKNRIDLINSREFDSSGKTNGCITSFYRCEIDSVRVLDSRRVEPEEKPVRQHSSVITMPQCEYERLKTITHSAVYMPTIDSRYHEAIQHISSCENVGVVGLSKARGRASALDLLVLSTWDQIYIFDLQLFNKSMLPGELQAIFKTKYVKKIMHDSRAFVDCMHHCYKQKVENIFDTQVADVMISKREGKEAKHLNLEKSLCKHFNFPNNVVHQAMTLDLEKWSVRPLPEGRKILAAILAVYLIPLKNLLENLLLKDFYSLVDTHSTSLLKCTAVEAQTILHADSNVI